MISIIIVNYNTRLLTKNCINSIFRTSENIDFEIIIIDNNSSGSDAEYLAKKFGDRIKLIRNESNVGFGNANNQGAAMASGELLFFLNSDTMIQDGVLKRLIYLFKKDYNLGAAAPRVLLENKQEQPYAFGSYPSLISVMFSKFKSSPRYKGEIFEVEWLSGVAMMVDKKIFEKMGGFDSNFFMYFEDIDICKRIKQAGYRIIIDPSVSLMHLCGKSESSNRKRKKSYYKSQDYYFKKHFSFMHVFVLRLFRFFYLLFK